MYQLPHLSYNCEVEIKGKCREEKELKVKMGRGKGFQEKSESPKNKIGLGHSFGENSNLLGVTKNSKRCPSHLATLPDI